jgi:dienelactone hydrolase
MMKKLFLLSLVLGILVSCKGSNNSTENLQVINKTDSCKTDIHNSYEVYVPKRGNADEKLPLLVILDSHGSGKFALKKFIPAANSYHAVLAASNLVKNGFGGYDAAIQAMIMDIREKYPVSETIFITGFSGGARMALEFALAHPVNGLILCGALAGPDQINAAHCTLISISGMDDFNFGETAQYLFQAQGMPSNLKIELTNASHDWPDSLLLADAFGFLRLSYQGKELEAPSSEQIGNYCKKQRERITNLETQGDIIKAALVAHNMSNTDVFKNDVGFSSSYTRLTSAPEYNNQMQKLGNCLNKELSQRQPYIDAFTNKDSLWWKNEIKSNNEKIKTEKDPFTRDMYKRIKGFWGIACYSFGNQLIQQHDAEALSKIVAIYRTLEPENAYVYYFSAFIPYWKGDSVNTVTLLQKAVKIGFTDIGTMKKDFGEDICRKVK